MGTTTNYGWTYPTVNADADAWGTILNNMAIAIDASLKTVDDGLAAKLAKASNLSDLANAATARSNLGLGTAAVANASNGEATVAGIFAAAVNNLPVYTTSGGSLGNSTIAAGNVVQKQNNLSELTSASTARSNLGLGSIATHNVTISSSSPSGGSDGDIWFQYA